MTLPFIRRRLTWTVLEARINAHWDAGHAGTFMECHKVRCAWMRPRFGK